MAQTAGGQGTGATGKAPAAAPAPQLAPAPAANLGAPSRFHLRSGDRVVFYGDSITEQRLYTTFVETFVLTRFPNLDTRFVHSGWSADRVWGGRGGGIDVRLARDVIAHKPTVVTIMLGMNDGRYRPFDEEIYRTFTTGYDHLLRTLRAALPQARITVIQPSPYDEVTRPAMKDGSYNEVLLRFGAFLRQVAARERLVFADFNTDLVRVLKKAHAEAPDEAAEIIPDRVHPSAAGQLVMAGALLKAWQAPALVSSVELDATPTTSPRLVHARNCRVTEVARADGVLRWRQVDGALPMPLDTTDPVTALAVRSSDLVATLNQQPLKVTGLAPGPYALRIDGRQVGVFRAAELARGINLGALPTPMVRQAADVHALTSKHNDIHFARWRSVQLRLAGQELSRDAAALEALDALEEELIVKQRAAARPRPRQFSLAPAPPLAANLPPGFTPVFGDGEGRYILVGARRYWNVEVHLEVEGDGDPTAGLMLRFNDKGQGYRVSLDCREGGSCGKVIPTGIAGITVPATMPPASPRASATNPTTAAGSPPTPALPAWTEHWKKGEWNVVRARIESDRAHVSVWLNGVQVTDWTGGPGPGPDDRDNDWGGLVALQLPVPRPSDGVRAMRVRNLALKELP